jgi:hypothetical protein
MRTLTPEISTWLSERTTDEQDAILTFLIQRVRENHPGRALIIANDNSDLTVIGGSYADFSPQEKQSFEDRDRRDAPVYSLEDIRQKIR